MPFSRSGPFRGLDAYCKDDELSEIGSQLAEGSINAGTVKPWRNSAFVLLVLAKARPWLSRRFGPSGVHLSLDELRMKMTTAEWRVGIISFFPRARIQRSDLG